MKYDFNVLEKRASQLIADPRFRDAIKIYLFMGDGDPSLDGGYLAERIGKCYENLEEAHAARYWFGRAVEENPHVRPYSAEARVRLESQIEADILQFYLG